MDTPTTDFVRAGSLEELKAKGRLVVRGPHRPILVVYDKDRVFALDNRCPHMGFPLSMESASPDLLTLMAGRGFKRFKAISQYNFLPIELPPSSEQRRYERVQWMLQTRNPLIRAFRLFGGRGWLNRQLNRSRKHADWTFPFGSSGPFGEDLPGHWLDHDELTTTLKHLLEFKEQKRSSPFWHEQEYSFWVDVHGRVD